MLKSYQDVKRFYESAIKDYKSELEILKVIDFKKNKDGSYNKRMILNVESYKADFEECKYEDSKYRVIIKTSYYPNIYFNDINEFKPIVNELIDNINNHIIEYTELLKKLPEVYDKVRYMLDDIDSYVKSEGFYSKYNFGI